MVFPVVRYGCESSMIKQAERWRTDAFELLVLERTPERPLDYKEIKPVNPKGNQPWIFSGRTDAEAEASIPWPPHAKNYLNGKDWCWARQKAKGEGDDRGWDGQIASLIRWTGIWANSGRQWRTEESGTLQSVWQRVGRDWSTEQQRVYVSVHFLVIGERNYKYVKEGG